VTVSDNESFLIPTSPDGQFTANQVVIEGPLGIDLNIGSSCFGGRIRGKHILVKQEPKAAPRDHFRVLVIPVYSDDSSMTSLCSTMILSTRIVYYLTHDLVCRGWFELALELLKNLRDMVFNFHSEWVHPVLPRSPFPSSSAPFADIMSQLATRNQGREFGRHIQKGPLCRTWGSVAQWRHNSTAGRRDAKTGSVVNLMTRIFQGTFISLILVYPFANAPISITAALGNSGTIRRSPATSPAISTRSVLFQAPSAG
jgi:hypothetical protein